MTGQRASAHSVVNRTVNRLAQVGVICMVAGGVSLGLGLFPYAADLEGTPGVGLTQLAAILAGLLLVIGGSYIVVRATLHYGRPRTLLRDVGVRLGMTGLLGAAASALADTLGFGSHKNAAVFGWLQAGGMLAGFLLAAVGVLIYAYSARRSK